ncbi:DUF4446 family protein [Candidatus Saccharibacteria bacterium]|nr:DUF4446 family protein [Candidatus Saccharibacteria bacterium]
MIYLALALAVIALIAAASSWLVYRRLRDRVTALLGGGDAGSLESTLTAHLKRVSAVDHRLATLSDEYSRLAAMTSLASQKISLVRFNPFGDTGGDQSFSLAVLDAHDSGYVLTSIHGREGTRVYVKPVDLGKSKYTLSVEEQQALTQAAKRVPPVTKET